MIAGSLGALTFAAPWMLAGLAALPVIWWLLRLTPPRPETVKFPPTLLLLGLNTTDKAPVRSPWWLTVLRMLVAAALILALAGPQLKPPSAEATATMPLFVVVDNGWAAASRWGLRRSIAEQLSALAEEGGQTLYLASTAGPASQLRPVSPTEFRQQFASLLPQPYPGDRAALARQIEKDLGPQRSKLRVIWLADGVEDAGAQSLRKALSDLAGGEKIEVYRDSAGSGPLAAVRLETSGGGAIRGRVLKAEPSARSGSLAAVTSRGDRLAVAPFHIPAEAAFADVSIDLPLELRNQVARLEIASEGSAGAVYLLDSSSHRLRAGLIASEEAENAQPLLSPSHYLQRALSPFADVILARTANLDKATEELVSQSPAVIILSDVGRLVGPPRQRLQSFVEKGGMLIRFAGPRLEQGGDGLLPAPLREGGRTLGGAMTWTSPQKLAPFEETSPFQSLSQPAEITISRQVLADPAAMARGVSVWARLADGTPLVTAARRGAGQLVFFHITANPDWSNLPMSGLFVEMMQKIFEASPSQLGEADQAAAAETNVFAHSPQDTFLKPWRLLDGFGKLSEPGERAQAIAASQIKDARPTPQNPAGLYGPQNALRTLNIIERGGGLTALTLPGNARLTAFTGMTTVFLAPWFFLAALGLFLADGLASALVLGRRSALVAKGAAAMLAVALVLAASSGDALAGPDRPAASADATAFALQASLETRLAYVLTGDAEADRISQAGLSGLSKVLAARTAVEPGAPMGVDPARDELVFFPLIYWPVSAKAEPLSDKVLAKIDAYMKQGGLIIFDTKSDETLGGSIGLAGGSSPLSRLLGKLDLPPLQRLPEDHVLTKSFYLLQSFPGRWDNGDLWVEARPEGGGDASRRGVRTDGVSSIIITSNDLAAAWALDDSDRPMFPTVPGGEEQREMSFRTGVNIVMYALTGNYKADQVHVPAILERLGH